MKHLLEILKENGYKEYRQEMISKKTVVKNGDEIIETKTYINSFKPNKTNSFSTMVEGGLCVFYIKDNDIENAVIWGLETQGKPPTLIQPKQHLLTKKGNVSFYRTDYILTKYDHKEIFNNLFKNVVYLENGVEIIKN